MRKVLKSLAPATFLAPYLGFFLGIRLGVGSAHDAGPVLGVWEKPIAADAHDAVPVSGGFWKNP